MIQGWLIYNKIDAKENSAYIDWFIEEARFQHMYLKLIYREDITIGILNNEDTVLIQGTPANTPDFAVIRTIDTMLSYHLETCRIHVFNSAHISKMCNHKSFTYQAVQKLGIPIVDTVFSHQSLLTQQLPLEFPFVVKESTGRSGQHVFLITNQEDWNLGKNKLNPTDLVIQSANVQYGKDIRVFVIGKTIIGAVLRENDNDFRANFKLGGTATWYDLSKHEKAMIQIIVNYFKFDMVGIDFLLNDQGELLFNEIEDVVGSRILSAVSNINLLKKYITHIKKQLI